MTSKLIIAMLMAIILMGTPRVAEAAEYPLGTIHVSSTEPGWASTPAIDGNLESVWSSAASGSGGLQWIGVWWSSPGYQPINYVTIAPRWYNGGSVYVPETVQLYVDQPGAPGTWTLVKTVALPANVAKTGYRIYFPKVNASGFKILATQLRTFGADPGGYRWQLAEVKVGLEDRFAAWSYATGQPRAIAGIDRQFSQQAGQLGQADAPRQAVGVYPRLGANGEKLPRSVSEASSAESGWPASSLVDGNAGTVWSSVAYSQPTPSTLPSFSFWLGSFANANYLKLVPRYVASSPPPMGTPDTSFHAPETVDIYYASYVGSPHWELLVSNYDLPAVPPAGLEASHEVPNPGRGAYEIPLPREVNTDGFMIVAKKLRADPNASNVFRFQMAEAYAGYLSISWDGSSAPGTQWLAFAQGNPGKLYIFGDEPDMRSISPDAYARAFRDFHLKISAVDPSARFSPAGIAWSQQAWALQSKATTVQAEPQGHFIDWAQQFYDRYQALYGVAPPVAEWRFNLFTDGMADLEPWKARMSAAVDWSMSRNAQMALGSFRPTAGSDSNPSQSSLMGLIMEDIKQRPNVVTAVWWTFEAGLPDSPYPLYQNGARTIWGNYFYQSKDLQD